MRGFKIFSDISKNRENYTLSFSLGPKIPKKNPKKIPVLFLSKKNLPIKFIYKLKLKISKKKVFFFLQFNLFFDNSI